MSTDLERAPLPIGERCSCSRCSPPKNWHGGHCVDCGQATMNRWNDADPKRCDTCARYEKKRQARKQAARVATQRARDRERWERNKRVRAAEAQIIAPTPAEATAEAVPLSLSEAEIRLANEHQAEIEQGRLHVTWPGRTRTFTLR